MYDINITPQPPLEPGDYVSIRNENRQKFEPQWRAPFRVRRATPIDTYQLTNTKGQIMLVLYHRNRLNKVKVGAVPPTTPWYDKQIIPSIETNEEVDDATTTNPGVLETEVGSNVVRDAPEAPARRDTTLGGVPRRHFEPNTNVVRRKANQ
ncbi:unnamed protein product [Umbelopsis vinacea]|jgi:molybdopterin/thiamine biosynthesis adenylyltransferase